MKNYTDSGTIRKRIEALNKKLDENESATKESGALPFWRGKKIISVKQWQSIANRGGYEQVIKYIPNGFIDNPLLGLTAAENRAGHVYKDEQYNKWMDDYYDYLHYSRNPQLGETYCQKCLLEDDKDQQVYSGLGLRKILRELIQQVLSLSSKDKDMSTTSSSPLPSSNSSNTTSPNHNCIQKDRQIAQAVSAAANEQKRKGDAKVIRKQLPLITIDYPCSVHNRFRCPYQESSESNDEALVSVGTYLEVIYNALLYAHTLTYQVRDYTYKVDLRKDEKPETISKYGWGFFTDSSKRLGVNLRSLKQPKVPIESIHDIYKALTDREKLDIILEQYLEHGGKNSQDNGDNSNFDYAKRKEMNDTLRRSIVDWFIQIKDHIRIEDLTNFNGTTLQEEEKNIQRRFPDQSAAITVDHSNDICCICNKSGACILCVNCDKWICVDHWSDHKRKYEIDEFVRLHSDIYKFKKTTSHKHHNKRDFSEVNSIKEQKESITDQNYLLDKLRH
jgi:hypothetical protein